MKRGFFAYSSNPSSCQEAIEEAIKRINETQQGVRIKSWRDLKIGGRYIINEILSEIDSSDFVCADLTGVNDNVLFELGYAIGKKKIVWTILDPSHIESFQRFKELSLLSSIGYTKYYNTNDIVNGFISNDIRNGNSLYEDLIQRHIPRNQTKKTPLLFLKSQIPTNPSQAIIDEMNGLKIPFELDDASESKVQSLSWYIEHIFQSPVILAQLSSTSRSGFEIQNAKCSFLSGLALGLGREVLMIAERPYESPLDYREILETYNNTDSCIISVRPFLQRIQKNIATLLTKREKMTFSDKAATEIQTLNLGEYIAEHESDNIYGYYVPTKNIESLIKNEYNIVLGRKGSGKTATLYYLHDYLKRHKKNIVCLIKPINLEIDGLLHTLKTTTEEYQRNYLIESIWKFLIYTEIAKTILDEITTKPLYAQSDQEKSYIIFAQKHNNILHTDFSTRLEEQLEVLREYTTHNSEAKQQDYKNKISEILHNEIIYKLKDWFGTLITSEQKLVVLIDNLDKSWKKNNDLNILSKFILGLLGATGRISRELSFIKSKQIKLSFQLIVFLRSDIFRYIMSNAREPDKIEYTKLSYNDPEVLFRIIEERFTQLNPKSKTADDLWYRFFPQNSGGENLKTYIFNRCLPRPRDIIYFLRLAKDTAVSRGHAKVSESDIFTAYTDYSSWVFTSILSENGVTLKQLEEFMYELMGSKPVISKDEILLAMMNSQIPHDEEQAESFIDHLISLSVLARETKEDYFEFEYDYDAGPRAKSLANKLNSNRFKIHPALHPYLECRL